MMEDRDDGKKIGYIIKYCSQIFLGLNYPTKCFMFLFSFKSRPWFKYTRYSIEQIKKKHVLENAWNVLEVLQCI